MYYTNWLSTYVLTNVVDIITLLHNKFGYVLLDLVQICYITAQEGQHHKRH